MITNRLFILLCVSLAWTTAARTQGLPDSVMIAHFIDVGQGDATLLEFSCGAVLIDVGGQSSADSEQLVAYLGTFFARRTDLDSTLLTIIITHNHVDHTRSLADLVQAFRVRSVVENGGRGRENDIGDRPLVWLNEQVQTRRRDIRIVDVDGDDIVADFGLTTPEIDPVECAGTNPEIRILSADLAENPGWRANDFHDKNNHSLVVRVDMGRASFLFTGDLEIPAIENLVTVFAGSPMLDADVYHVGHHGSHNGTTWSLLEALVQPEIAIISMGSCTRRAGLFNAYQFGHPRAVAVDMLSAAIRRRRATPKSVSVADGVRDFRRVTMRDAVFATGWDGTVTVRATAGGQYRVELERQDAPPTC